MCAGGLLGNRGLADRRGIGQRGRMRRARHTSLGRRASGAATVHAREPGGSVSLYALGSEVVRLTNVRITHIGGPTTLIEFAGWRILTDPTFDPAGKRYFFGWGTTSKKTAGPSHTPAEVGEIDAVLISHHHHG